MIGANGGDELGVGYKCAAHSDCPSYAPFCFDDGVCDLCSECHYCHDGIDGTCGDCGSQYPIKEDVDCDNNTHILPESAEKKRRSIMKAQLKERIESDMQELAALNELETVSEQGVKKMASSLVRARNGEH